MPDYAVGVDLGTTYTAAAVLRAGRVDVVELGDRVASVASVLWFRDDHGVVVGEAAVRRAESEPGRVAREFKRRFGDPVPIMVAGTPMSADALTARLLRWVIDTVTEQEGGPPSAVGVAHPANWGPYKLDLLAQAVRLAGVPQARLVSEPVAAAESHATAAQVAAQDVVAVYDLGGGTFDAAVLQRGESGFELLGRAEGIERLGGIDFDEAVFDHVRQSLGTGLAELDHHDPVVGQALARLHEECAEAKEALSADTEVSIPVALPGVHTTVRLTRGEFEEMIRPSVASTIEMLSRVTSSAGLAGGELSKVLLIGGSSRIPLVSLMVNAELGVPVALDTYPKHAVAMGAAHLAGVDGPSEEAAPAAPAAPIPATPAGPVAAGPAQTAGAGGLGAGAAAVAGAAVAGAAAARGADTGPPTLPEAPVPDLDRTAGSSDTPGSAAPPGPRAAPPVAGRQGSGGPRPGGLGPAGVAGPPRGARPARGAGRAEGAGAAGVAGAAGAAGAGDAGTREMAQVGGPPLRPPPPSSGPGNALDSSGPPPGKRRSLVTPLVVVVLLLIAAVILTPRLIGLARGGGLLPVGTAAGEVFLEPAAQPGPDPFTAPVANPNLPTVGSDSAVGTAPDKSGPQATRGIRGDSVGLYGGTDKSPICDKDELVAFLRGDSTKAAAWAATLDVPTSKIARYVGGLTPVLLQADTRVTNHGYRDGEVTDRQAVLQAGTAVLVDEKGQPRVRCGSGNPLTEAVAIPGKHRYTGSGWSTFDPSRTSVVLPAAQPVDRFVLRDVDTGQASKRPAGTDGDSDVTSEVELPPYPPVLPQGTEAPSSQPGAQDPNGQQNPSGQENPTREQNPGEPSPTGQYPGGQEPTGQEPTGQEPTGQEPTGQEPTGQYPGGQEPTGQEPTGQEPTGQEPGGQDPGYSDPGGDPGGQEPGSPGRPDTGSDGTSGDGEGGGTSDGGGGTSDGGGRSNDTTEGG